MRGASCTTAELQMLARHDFLRAASFLHSLLLPSFRMEYVAVAQKCNRNMYDACM